jgi:hypothetical protein
VKKSKPKTEAAKTGLSGFGYQSIRFFQKRWSLILGLSSSLFKKDLHVFESKSYVLLPIET